MKKKKNSQIGFHVAAGVMDGFGVAAAALALGVLLMMLRQDLAMTFADISDNITDAVIIGK